MNKWSKFYPRNWEKGSRWWPDFSVPSSQ